MAKFLFEVFPGLFGAVSTGASGSSSARASGLFAERPLAPGIKVLDSSAAIENLFSTMISLSESCGSAAGAGAGAGGESMVHAPINPELCSQVIAYCRAKMAEPINMTLDSGVFHSVSTGYQHVVMPLVDVLAAIATLILDKNNIYFREPEKQADRVVELLKSISTVMRSGVCHTGQRDAIIGVIDGVEFYLAGSLVSYHFPASIASYFTSLQVKYIGHFLEEKQSKSYESYMTFMLHWLSDGGLSTAELEEIRSYLNTGERKGLLNADLREVGLNADEAKIIDKKRDYFDAYLQYVEPVLGNDLYLHSVQEVLAMNAEGAIAHLGYLKLQVNESKTEDRIERLKPQLNNFIVIQAIRKKIKRYKSILLSVAEDRVAEVLEAVEAIISAYDAAAFPCEKLTDSEKVLLGAFNKYVNDFRSDPLTLEVENIFAKLFSDEFSVHARKLDCAIYLNKFHIDSAWLDEHFPEVSAGGEVNFSLYVANKLLAFCLTNKLEEWPARTKDVLNQLIIYIATRLGVDEPDTEERERHRLLKETSYQKELLALLRLLVDQPLEIPESELLGEIKKMLQYCVRYNLSTPMAKLFALLPEPEQGKFLHGNAHELGNEYSDSAPLFIAACSGYQSVLQALLKISGCDVNAANCIGMTALYIAAGKGRLEVVKFLLVTSEIDINSATNKGFTALHIAVRNGHFEVVKILLAASEIDINSATNEGFTALHTAAQYGNFEVFNALLAIPGIDVNKAADNGITALYFAAQYGNVEVVNALLAIPGIDVNKAADNGITALYNAARSGHLEVVKALLAVPTIDINKAVDNGITALYIAVLSGHLEVVKALLAVPTIEINKAVDNGFTALHIGARYRRIEVVKALLAIPGVDVNKAADNGFTALYIAAQNGYLEIVNLLPFNEQALRDSAKKLRDFSSTMSKAIQQRMNRHIGNAAGDEIVTITPSEIAGIMGYTDVAVAINSKRDSVVSGFAKQC
ncbi:MAG: ankyrin repeat domain-containing protein [Coxiellaceae bacterium]|nr:ankyrin repeat domain-containing protein [Coxiellaceae bacterium]